MRILLQHSGASHGVIALADDERGLVLRASGSSSRLKGDLDIPLSDPAAADLAPVSILGYVERTGQVAGSKELSITSHSDPFLERTRPAAIFASPIRCVDAALRFPFRWLIISASASRIDCAVFSTCVFVASLCGSMLQS